MQIGGGVGRGVVGDFDGKVVGIEVEGEVDGSDVSGEMVGFVEGRVGVGFKEGLTLGHFEGRDALGFTPQKLNKSCFLSFLKLAKNKDFYFCCKI